MWVLRGAGAGCFQMGLKCVCGVTPLSANLISCGNSCTVYLGDGGGGGGPFCSKN